MAEFEERVDLDVRAEAPAAQAEIPDVYYELADELAEVQADLRKATGVPRPHRHHHGPHGPHGGGGPHGHHGPHGPHGPECGCPHHGPHHGPHGPEWDGPRGPRPVPPAPVGPDGFAPRPPEPPLPPEEPGAEDRRKPRPVPVAPLDAEDFKTHFAHGPAMPGAEAPAPDGGPRPAPFAERDPRAPHPMDRMGRGTMATLRYLTDHDGEASPGAMAAELGLSNARISNILAALEKRGYVTREHDPADGRKVVVKLTDEGASHSAGMVRGVRGELASFLADLGEDDARELIAILKRVTEVAVERRDRAIDAQIQGLMDTLDPAE